MIYREAAFIYNEAEECKKLVVRELFKALKFFVSAANRPIVPLANESENHYAVRRLGGYKYHLMTSNRDGMYRHFSICDVIQLIYGLYHGKTTLDELAAALTKILSIEEHEAADNMAPGSGKMLFPSTTLPLASARKSNKNKLSSSPPRDISSSIDYLAPIPMTMTAESKVRQEETGPSLLDEGIFDSIL